MNTVVLTFPGHFFQTAACIQSLHLYHPEHSHNITVIADDVQCAPWSDYVQDLTQNLDSHCRVVPVSTLPGIRNCVAGWWRQQLVKLTLDRVLPGTEWFVIDGDVIFRSRCDVIDCVPISRRYDASSRWSQMCARYVQALLGTDQGVMQDQGRPVITSPVPFRHLDSTLLHCLRQHVESRFGGDFLDLHLRWFQDQTIVADIDPPTRWVMSEWELIECFRRLVQNQQLPFREFGSGYQIDVDTAQIKITNGIFVHSYRRDAGIAPEWFHTQGITVDADKWRKMLAWHEAREVQRLV